MFLLFKISLTETTCDTIFSTIPVWHNMSKYDKKLKKWLENTPTDVPKQQVVAVLDRCFSGQWRFLRGSHIVVQDDRLIGYPGYGPEGDFDIPVKGGQKVKGVYLKRLAQTIKLLEEMEE
ncbi:MAG: hypothetical protein JRI47_06295 [Deltaproteobacteria bacterium]|nr:hypothetical protein [Deltaproteobacteria bacterium]